MMMKPEDGFHLTQAVIDQKSEEKLDGHRVVLNK